MRMKAAAYKQYGDAAMMSLVLDALPKVAAEVAAPLSKVIFIIFLIYINQSIQRQSFIVYIQALCTAQRPKVSVIRLSQD